MPLEQFEIPKIIVEKRAEKTSMDTPEYRKLGKHGECVFLTNAGVAQGKGNEDGLAIVVKESSVTLFVADGIGAPGNGDIAANLCCDAVISTAQSENDDFESMSNAMEKAINASSGLKTNQGCCYSLTRIEKDVLTVRYTGDVRTLVVRDGTVVFATEDDGDTMWERRNFIGSYLSKNHDHEYSNESFTLMLGDVVLICSDGVTDNVDERREADEKAISGHDEKDADAGNAMLAQIIAAGMTEEYEEEASLQEAGTKIQRFVERRMAHAVEQRLSLWKSPTEKIMKQYQTKRSEALAAMSPQPVGKALEALEVKVYNKIITEAVRQRFTAKIDNFTFVLYRHGTSKT